MEESVRAQLRKYLQEPSAERFKRLRDAVAGSPDYVPYSPDLQKGHELMNEGRFEEARDHLLSVMSNCILNPGIHHLLSYAHHELGDEHAARVEFSLAKAMMEGILSTGDGSAARPYLVLHTADQYDVLRHLGKRPQMQRLVEKGKRRYDQQTCEDGSEIWFDVTVQLSRLHGSL